jgi:hypothetical protein
MLKAKQCCFEIVPANRLFQLIFGIEFALKMQFPIFVLIEYFPAQKPQHIKMVFSNTNILVGACYFASLYITRLY